MPSAAKLFLTTGAVAMLAAVALGAFGAHALKSQIAPDLLAVYRTGVEYHFYHAIGLLIEGQVNQFDREVCRTRRHGTIACVDPALRSRAMDIMLILRRFAPPVGAIGASRVVNYRVSAAEATPVAA